MNRTTPTAAIYDAALLLRDALEKSGLNRVLLLEEIRNITPWEGENGTITWDPLGQNSRQGNIKKEKDKVSTEVSAIKD